MESEKATAVNESGRDRIDVIAEKAVQVGFKNVVLVELMVIEGNVLWTYF